MSYLKRQINTLVYARDSYHYTNRVLLIPKLLGFCPLDAGFHLSSPHLCMTLVIFTLMTFSAWKTIYYVCCKTVYAWGLSKYLDLTEIIVSFANCVLCFSFLLCMRRSLMEALNSLHLIERKLSSLGRPLKYNLLIGMSPTLARFFCILILAFEPTTFPDDESDDEEDSGFPYTLYNIYLGASFMASHLTMCPFYALVSIIVHQFRRLNSSLRSLNITMDITGRRKLEQLIVVNMELYDTCYNLNSIFSWVTYILLSSAFAIIIVNVYFICYICIALADKNESVYVYIFSSISSTFMWTLEIYTITYLCVHVKKQSMLFDDEVYKLLLNDKHDNLGRSGKVQAQLTFKPTAKFQACGFLDLDYSLIHGVIAATTTYTVLLIQFGAEAKSSGKPTEAVK